MEAPAQVPVSVPVVINKGTSIYRIIGIVVAFVILASLMSFSKDLFNIDLNKYYYDIYYYYYPLKSATTNEDETRSGPAPVETSENASESKTDKAGSAEQFWCFVGEDMVGRWCVQVLAPNMCPAERTYAFKNECEKVKSA